MFYWYSLHLHVIASRSSISGIKLKMKAHFLVQHIQQHMLCLRQCNSLWQIQAHEWLQAQQKWILPLSPCSQQLSLQILLVCPYWRCIRIGSSHLALTKADQSCQSFGGLGSSLHCTPDLQPHVNWNCYILHVSVEPRGRWAQWAAGLSDQCYWPLDLCLNCRLMCEGTMCVMAENSLALATSTY